MSINIYKDTMMLAYLFGNPVLYSDRPIPIEDVPEYWSRYDLCGTARDPQKPYAVVDQAQDHYVASILSPLTLKKDGAQKRLVKDKFELVGIGLTLTKFCADRGIPQPKMPLRHQFRPASPEEAGFFYALPPEKDAELGAIGHVRMDFGSSGQEFWHTWWPRGPEELDTREFKEELCQVVDDLRKGVLKDLGSMRSYCREHGGAIQGGSAVQNHGYVLTTDRYVYRLRCNPVPGDYQAYLACFVNQEQKMGLANQGWQKMLDAADPNLPHSYDWYVMESCNMPGEQYTEGLTLEEALRRYSASEHEDKRLGVTKDDIAAVDLLIRHEGREWLSGDRLKMDEFRDDPVVAEAVPRLQQMLGPAPVVGRIAIINGDSKEFTDAEQYLQAIREELPYRSVTGFQYETLTDAPEVRKAADDIVYDLCAEENPRTLADYGGTDMAMKGMSL